LRHEKELNLRKKEIAVLKKDGVFGKKAPVKYATLKGLQASSCHGLLRSYIFIFCK